MKTAVILYNLGGPDSLQAVKPFLFNLFNDQAIIALPQPFRWFLAKIISNVRNKKAQNIYAQIGGKSPINEETKAQAIALEKYLKAYGKYKVFYFMRYWHPFAYEIIQEMVAYNPQKIILLPLYPQFSLTTTNSANMLWHRLIKKLNINIPTQLICSYADHENFINAYVDLIKREYKKAVKYGKPRVLFSAHGIPINRIKMGDPYQKLVELTTSAIIKKLKIKNLSYTICYQSKVGPLRWLEPSTEHEIIKAANDKYTVVVAPISFVSEHSETMVELDIEYKKLAKKHGCSHYFRVPTVRTHKFFIKCLAELCLECEKAPYDGYNIASGDTLFES